MTSVDRTAFSRAAALRLGAGGIAALALGGAAPASAQRASNEVALAARRFLGSLDDAQRARATFMFAGSERTRWHWTVPASVPRNGLPLGTMTPAQRALALRLLRASSSASGYRKTLQIMSLQGVLRRLQPGSGDTFDPDLYYVSVFGSPGAGIWGWRFEGHHLSRHFTLVRGALSPDPFFLGAWPTMTGTAYRAVGSRFRTMPREEDAARELLRLLDGRLRRQAVFSSESLTDHVTQNAARVRPPSPVGILASDLPSAGQTRVLELVQTYLANHPSPIGEVALTRIRRAGLGRIRFGWAGSDRPGVPHYYRLQGPTFLLEFDNSRDDATHIHSVWRDFTRDFGRHAL